MKYTGKSGNEVIKGRNSQQHGAIGLIRCFELADVTQRATLEL